MTIEELNDAIADGSIGEVVRVAEARQCKALSKIADIVCGRPGIRLILVAGGSSAGKTTTAKRLATQIRVNGREVVHLSTDDYFVGDARNPRDENGELDYEHVKCVDIEPLAADILALFRGDSIRERRFDFVNHVPMWKDASFSLRAGGFVILEGSSGCVEIPPVRGTKAFSRHFRRDDPVACQREIPAQDGARQPVPQDESSRNGEDMAKGPCGRGEMDRAFSRQRGFDVRLVSSVRACGS